MAYKRIIYAPDPLLIVLIDSDSMGTGTVFYDYDDRGEKHTPFQTADMPMDEQKAAAKVNEWLEDQGW